MCSHDPSSCLWVPGLIRQPTNRAAQPSGCSSQVPRAIFCVLQAVLAAGRFLASDSCQRNCYLSMNSSKEPNLGIRFEENIHVQCGPLTLVAVVTPGVPDVTKFFLTTTYFLSCCWGVKWKTAILRWSCLFCHISRRTTGFQHESPLLSISPNANTSYMGFMSPW